MSIFKDIIDEFITGEKKSNVSIDKYLYLKLLEESNTEDISIEQLLNKILYERYDIIENEIKNKEKEEIHEKDLIKYYKILDKYLYATLEGNITIAITNDSIGYDEREYVLKDYALTKVYSKLSLKLERNNEDFPISFKDIKEIRFNDYGDRLKVWIYMPKETWRFYLNYDNNKLESMVEDFNSNKLEIQTRILPYEKFKNVDNLKYYLEKMKYNLASYYSGEKVIKTKNGDEIYFVNSLSYEKDSLFGRNGSIYFISELGDYGKLYYSIKEDLFSDNKEPYVEIIDIVPIKINIGIGSEALKYLEEIIVENNIKQIKGDLSPNDLKNHGDRLIHFYQKNGYEIRGNKIYKSI